MREHTRLAEDLKMVQRELRDKDAKLELLVRRYEVVSLKFSSLFPNEIYLYAQSIFANHMHST